MKHALGTQCNRGNLPADQLKKQVFQSRLLQSLNNGTKWFNRIGDVLFVATVANYTLQDPELRFLMDRFSQPDSD